MNPPHLWLGAATVLALVACTHRGAASDGSTPGDEGRVGYPGTLLAPASYGADFQWQQRVTAQWEGKARSFEAVLSKSEDELLLIGLSPMKTPGFIVRLADGEVSFENRSPEKLPFDPQYMMFDVQRAYYPWIPGEPPSDGERKHRVEGEIVHERWQGGRLRERRFRREDGRPSGEIAIHYEGWEEGLDAPRTTKLVNGWFGYTLVIETLVQERL